MPTYGNPHTLPPVQCSSNTPTWTDPTITADVTKVKKAHIDDLRNYLNAELSRRGLSSYSFTDSTIIADSTKLRTIHITDMRSALDKIHIGDCSGDTYYCPQDALACASADLTDQTLTPNSTKFRDVHVTQIRSKLQTLMTSCICEAEQCQYCSDCGYYYTTCSLAGVSCDNSKYSSCSNTPVPHYICASTNLPTWTAHPYKSASGDPLSTEAWDGTVPWAMCNYTPPGSNWGSCEHRGGHDHTADWNCKCNPFTWP
jgi:hypothetical protein